MTDTVRVEFDPPRQCEEHGKSWCLSADGEATVYLPKSQTQLERKDTETVRAATIPQWLAINEGLAEDDRPSFLGEEEVKMTRDDWFLLGLTMAFVIRGEPKPLWEAGKLIRKLREDL